MSVSFRLLNIIYFLWGFTITTVPWRVIYLYQNVIRGYVSWVIKVNQVQQVSGPIPACEWKADRCIYITKCSVDNKKKLSLLNT